MKDIPLKRGDLVRMTHTFKSMMNAQILKATDGTQLARKNPKKPHPLIKECGRCVGVVEGLVDWGDGRGRVGPEYDVRWKPSGLRYMYDAKDLQIVRRS